MRVSQGDSDPERTTSKRSGGLTGCKHLEELLNVVFQLSGGVEMVGWLDEF